jgi:2-polyprenyl-3-methyl-5-hydroxy-6-metoxy-1,4-benzoquinol methylase
MSADAKPPERSEGGYQDNYSALYSHESMDPAARRLKADKTLAVLKDQLGDRLRERRALEVGCASGGVSLNLCREFAAYTAVDIDANAIASARNKALVVGAPVEFHRMNSEHLDFADKAFDVVICSHLYEHVPSARRMLDEIYRVLGPGGVCYFAAGNRLQWMEPHHRLPLLSVLPKFMADRYLHVTRHLDKYYENHLTVFGLRSVVNRFELIDYTRRIVDDPVAFCAVDQIAAGSLKHWFARLAVHWGYWLFPTYIWLLRKPAT